MKLRIKARQPFSELDLVLKMANADLAILCLSLSLMFDRLSKIHDGPDYTTIEQFTQQFKKAGFAEIDIEVTPDG